MEQCGYINLKKQMKSLLCAIWFMVYLMQFSLFSYFLHFLFSSERSRRVTSMFKKMMYILPLRNIINIQIKGELDISEMT